MILYIQPTEFSHEMMHPISMWVKLNDLNKMFIFCIYYPYEHFLIHMLLIYKELFVCSIVWTFSAK